MSRSGARGAPSSRDDFDLRSFLPYRFSVVTNRISRALAPRYSRAFGISIPEWRVLAVLGNFAPLSSNEICGLTAMDKAKVSRAVTRLVSAGLLRRRVNPNDRRHIMLTLTKKGRTVYQAVVPIAVSFERTLAGALNREEKLALDGILRKLEAHALERGEG